MSIEQRLSLWADELRAIANEGLHWMADNPYEFRRYERILRIAAAMFAMQDARDVETIERAYHDDLGHIAPYPAGDAAIFDQEGRILLIRRKDNGLWAMPGGAFEVGKTPCDRRDARRRVVQRARGSGPPPRSEPWAAHRPCLPALARRGA